MAHDTYDRVRETLQDEPGLAAAGLATALGTGALGASYLGRKLPKMPAETRGLAEQFLAARDIADPQEFVRQYAIRGSRLTQAPAFVFPSGTAMTGRDVALAARNSLPARLLARAGVVPKVQGAGSVEHYDAFSRGPHAALEQMKSELGAAGVAAGDAPWLGPNTTRLLEERFRPAVSKNYPKLIRPLVSYGRVADALGHASPMLRNVGMGALGLGALLGLGTLAAR